MTEKRIPSKLVLPPGYNPDPEKLTLMMNSIKEKSTLHPPCVKDNGEVFAGEIHVLACQRLNLPEIECRVYPSNLEPEDYKEIAVHKNLQVPNLTWDEQVTLEKELHELRQVQNGKGKQGKKVGWSLRDTAEELNVALGVLSEDIRMAEAIMLDPSLKRIKDKTTAKRVILSQVKRSNQEVSSGVPVQAEVNVCIHGGSEVVLKAYPDAMFDACITDPPWLEFKDPKLTRDQFTLPVFQEVYRVLKANSFLYAIVSTQDWYFYYEKLGMIGFNIQKYPLIWLKEGVLTQGTRSWEHQRDYEPILLAVKGSPALVDNMVSSVISCKVVHSSRMIHPNEKPPELIKKLILYSTYDNAVILDPFAGSGVTLECCRQLRRRFVGIENDRKFYENICLRLKKNETT